MQDDWAGECLLNGEIEVDIMPDASSSDEQRKVDPNMNQSGSGISTAAAASSHEQQQQASLNEKQVFAAAGQAAAGPTMPSNKARSASPSEGQSALKPSQPAVTVHPEPPPQVQNENSRKELSHSVSDENVTPNRQSRTRRQKGSIRTGLSARNILSTDGSDIDEGQKAESSRARRRRGRQYHVQEEGPIADSEVEVRAVLGRPDPPSSISRALMAKLFTSSISALVQEHRTEVPFTEWSEFLTSDMNIENQTLGFEDVVIQILAVKLPETFSHVYFTFQFYHFSLVETPVAVLERIPAQDLQVAQVAMCPAILRVLDGAQQASGTPGVTVHFVVDSARDAESAPHPISPYYRYLSARTLCVEMWDANSKLPIGCANIDLRLLLRRGNQASQTGGEFFLTSDQSPADDESVEMKAHLPTSISSVMQSSVYIRLISVLRPSTAPQLQSEYSNNSESREDRFDQERLDRVGLATVNKGMALLYARKDRVIEALKNLPEHVPAQRLQDAIISSQLELTASEVTALVLHLRKLSSGLGEANVNQVRLGGQDALDKSGDRRIALQTSANEVLEKIALHFDGDVQKAFDAYSANGMMDESHLRRLLSQDNQELASVLLRLASADVDGRLSSQQFCNFFSVSYKVDGSASLPMHVDKKLARWQKIRAKRQKNGTRIDDTAGEDKQLFLEAAKHMREVHKESQIKQFLQKCITTHEVIYPSFGQVCYVPYLLCSPFSEMRVIAIRTDDPELVLVTDVEEWRELERHSVHRSGVIEEDLFSRERAGYSICLQPHQKVVVPFKIRITSPEHISLDSERVAGHVSAASVEARSSGKQSEPANRAAASAIALNRKKTVRVTFSAYAADGQCGPPLYVLEIEMLPRPFVVDHTFRLYNCKHDFLKRRIVLDTSLDRDGCSWRGGAPRSAQSRQRNIKYLWCSNASVVVSPPAASGDSHLQEIHLKHRCGEAGQEDIFYLLLYNDAYHVGLYEIWLIRVTALNRLDIDGLVGQTEPSAVMVRSRTGPQPVRAFSSAPAVVSFPESCRNLDDGLSEFRVDFHPLLPGRRDVLVHIMPDSMQAWAGGGASPLSAWLLSTTARMPLVARRYDIRLQLGRVSNKKILYSNPYG